MSRAFRRARGGGVSVVLDAAEIQLLHSFTDQVLTMLAGRDDGESVSDELTRQVGLSSVTEPPDDPVLARLLPTAYLEDEESAREFRRYTETDLIRSKRSYVRTMQRSLDRGPGTIYLDEAEARAWMTALNDVRLALGTRWQITEEDDAEAYERMAEDDPRRPVLAVYDWLTLLQETLVEAVR